jgi:cation transport protein ChaC
VALTREQIKSGYIAEMIRSRDHGLRLLTDEERAASIRRMLADWRGEDLWVFGYGSLIWNPAFHYEESRRGRIHGYHRRFCLWTPLGRGTPDNPGLVLGLDPGGACTGVAFRVAAAKVEEEFEIIWRREMVAGAYCPTWVRVHSPGSEPWPAVTFVMNPAFERYAGRLPEEAICRTLATAAGELGSSAEYLINTVDHLVELGINDRHLLRLRDKVLAHDDCAE